MKTRPLLAIALLALGTGIALPGIAGSDLRQDEVRQLRASGKILPMEDILNRARSAQPGQIVEVELDREHSRDAATGAEQGRYVYEVKVIDDQDRIHKLELDAGSGEVLRRKQK
jgi:uncharacterized membrane protein YkoI